jgi:hypothetical protein
VKPADDAEGHEGLSHDVCVFGRAFRGVMMTGWPASVGGDGARYAGNGGAATGGGDGDGARTGGAATGGGDGATTAAIGGGDGAAIASVGAATGGGNGADAACDSEDAHSSTRSFNLIFHSSAH